MVKDQLTADEEDDGMTEQDTISVKNPSGRIKDLKNDPVARSLPKAVKKGFGKNVTKIDAMKTAGITIVFATIQFTIIIQNAFVQEKC